MNEYEERMGGLLALLFGKPDTRSGKDGFYYHEFDSSKEKIEARPDFVPRSDLTLNALDRLLNSAPTSPTHIIISPRTKRRINQIFHHAKQRELLHRKRFPHLTKHEFQRILIKE